MVNRSVLLGGSCDLRVLLVEDSKILSERISEVIRHIVGVDLIGTTDAETVAVAVAVKDSVDVIVLDLHLRQGTGFGVLRALTASRRKPAIIVLTNYDLPEYKTAAMALGATHFLDKARDYDRLPGLIEEIGRARRAVN